MNVRNCKLCGRIFNYAVGPIICPRCREEREEKFQQVKAYIIEHPGADIMEVAEDCEVESSQIREWIREERLQFADDSPIMIACEGCGTMIRSGRFCNKCKTEMTNGFKNAIGANKPANPEPAQRKINQDGNRMRFL